MSCGILPLSLLLPIVLPSSVAPLADAPGTAVDAVLVTVNGRDITQSDLEAEYLSRQVPETARAALRERLIEDLIDRALLDSFLQKRQVTAPERELELQVRILRRAAGQSAEEFAAALSRLGLTEASLREHLALPLAWRSFVRRTVTDEQLQQHFARHRAELDGTEVRASQIVISMPADADETAWSAAETKLSEIRADLAADKLTFADAARRHSSSPSRNTGGDLGFFAYRGRLPVAISSVAFSLQPGEFSQPFRTAFGVHLVTVTERRPGELSLEDVRSAVLDQISRELWDQQVQAERKAARIQRRVPAGGTESR
jgi:peptidyl-prolyl cis-trans isomerase C